MADVSDAEQALVNLASLALYPSGVSGPTAASPVTGTVVTVTRGYPTSSQLDAVLAASSMWVAVQSRNHSARMVPMPLKSYLVSKAATTWTAALAGNSLTIGGTYTAGQPIMVTVARVGYSYQPLSTDTPTLVAAGIAALVPGASSVGAVVSLPGDPTELRVNLVTTGILAMPQRRQTQDMFVRVYAPTPLLRDTAMKAIDLMFVATLRPQFVDGTFGLLRYSGVSYDDTTSRDGLFERVNTYQVEFNTVVLSTLTSIGNASQAISVN